MRKTIAFAAIVFLMLAFGGAHARAADSAAVTAAKKRLADTQSELSRANAAVAVIIHKARAELEATAEWKRAAADLREAEAHHANVNNAVRAKLRQSPEYKAAADARFQSQMKRDALREDPKTTPDKLAQAAIDLLNASSAVTKLETQALASDSHVADAAAKEADTHAKLEALLKTLPDLAMKDPGFDAARQHVQTATAAANDAAKQLASAKQQQDATAEQQMNQDIDNRRDQMRNITGFRR